MNAAATSTSGTRWARREGHPYPLGVTLVDDGQAFNFALYSKHATAVTLLFYGDASLAQPVTSFAFDYRQHKSGRIWHCCIPAHELADVRYYAYRVDGPPPSGRYEWHAFDPAKVLLDPYAGAVYVPPTLDRQAASRPGSNAGRAPLGVLPRRTVAFDWDDDLPPRHESDAIVYELHVGGFTQHSSSGVAADLRGTFAGVVEKIPYLLELGVTIVELMPVFQFDASTGDFWGYSPLSFFAPHDRYAGRMRGDADTAFREMVRALHRAGMEVVLDVVYNHTCEGGHRGPVYSYKGIDNSTYYLIGEHAEAPYVDLTGTGNTLNCANRYVRKMIMDSIRHWVRDMHVDGFRLDLASIFSRNDDGSINTDDAPLMSDLASDPELARIRLIVEPWDASGTFQLGRAFPGVMAAQWNARFRDDVRRFVRGDEGLVGALMQRLYGSDDLFPDDLLDAYHPYQSVNFVTCHDGFTLYDLLTYEHKHNEANGEGNADGVTENYSWNSGWEGDERVPADVIRLRKQQARNFCCLLLLANGTPMLRAGDEFLHTQRGNNNPYNQDNKTGWLDWRRLEAHSDVFRFFKRMIAFRKAHPSLARSRFWRDDVRWFGPMGEPDLSPPSRSLAFLLRGGSEDDDDLYVMINAGVAPIRFAVPGPTERRWYRAIDTALASPDDIVEPNEERPLAQATYDLAARAVGVLVGRR